jgi:hypothetical protein
MPGHCDAVDWGVWEKGSPRVKRDGDVAPALVTGGVDRQ